jgi:Protein of unknown function (DUF3716)
VNVSPEPLADMPDEDELAFAEALLKRQDGEQTPVECGYCNESFPFRTCRLLLAEDFGEVSDSDERYIFLCENCWWEVIGNPRQDALRSMAASEGFEPSGAADANGPLDEFSLIADLKQRDEADESRSPEDA